MERTQSFERDVFYRVTWGTKQPQSKKDFDHLVDAHDFYFGLRESVRKTATIETLLKGE